MNGAARAAGGAGSILAHVDRDAIARAQREREARDALEFERQREELLLAQIADTVLAAERARIDGEAFAQMVPEDVVRVRELLADHADHAGDDDADADADADTLEQDEIDRLLGEIERSRASQGALERFIQALNRA